jgi:hypothetical protein
MLVHPIALAAHFDQVAVAHQEIKELLEQPGIRCHTGAPWGMTARQD